MKEALEVRSENISQIFLEEIVHGEPADVGGAGAADGMDGNAVDKLIA